MKLLSAVLVILVMLGICTSSYGYFLIYNMSGVIKGTDGTIDAKKIDIHFRGYLVLNFNDDMNSLVDSNMILYGKNQQHHKVYVILNSSDVNHFLETSASFQHERNFYSLNGHQPFDFNSLVMGNTHRKDIGRDANGHNISKVITPDMSGTFTQEQGIFFDLDENIAAIGDVSVTLYGVATKGVNSPRNDVSPHDPDGIIETLKKILARHHYRQVNIPAPE